MNSDAHQVFTRAEWSALRANTPLTVSESDLEPLRGANEHLSLDEVVNVYLPLSRLLNLHFDASRRLIGVKDAFLGHATGTRPFIIGVAGSVAVGKSTFARVLQALLARWLDHPRVELVTTDGFLHPNAHLEANGIMNRKGFPESYDLRRMIQFLADIKAGFPEVHAPTYSHVTYDIIPDRFQQVLQPDVLIFEGLNVLQTTSPIGRRPSVIVSDFFDFSLYLDADEADIEQWYVDRFLLLQRTVFQTRASYFQHLRGLTPEEVPDAAREIWRSINRVNLVENILPTRERADVVVRKSQDHSISEIWLR